MDPKTELRKLSPGNLFTLIQILEYDESWKRLMAIIPKYLILENFESKIAINNLPKYNTEHFKLIENAGCKEKKPCSEILFEEWGTSGRIRPRLGHLLRLLERAELYRAADYVAVDLLDVVLPERPKSGPAAKVDINVTFSDSNTTTSNSNINIERLLDQIDYPSSILSHSNQSNNNFNRNIEPAKLIIPKIVIDEVNTTSNNVQASNNNSSNTNKASDETSDPSLVWREMQLHKKIEKLIYSPQIPENETESTIISSTNSTQSSNDSDMIKFSSSENQIPALTSLLNNDESIPHETFNYSIPHLSELISSSETKELPAFSQILNSNEEIVPAFSQILSNTDLPSFGQIMQSNSNIPASALPSFEQLISRNSEENVEIPHISVLLANESNSNVIQKSSTTELTVTVTRKTSLSPGNTSSSRTTCASPLPNLSLNTILPHFTYQELEQCTDNFDETILNSHHSIYESEPKGRKLGSGAFGSVYLCTGLLDKPVAVKKLNLDGVNVVNIDDTITKQFRNEVELLCKYKHDNLLSLLGYSCDGPTYCLVYEYICGGALKDRLQSIENRLIWTNRLYIALGTAKAVSYLHYAYSMPLIHRDIKTANILLDNAEKPKLCDFGLIKLTPNQNTNTSTTVFGTSAYMAPEAFRGDVSVKLDTFSFGVVLLELLTGLPPLDENREGNDLVTHVEDVCEDDIKPLLDTRAGSWTLKNIHFGDELYKIAMQCLEEKKRRSVMTDVVKQLSELIDNTI